GTSYASLIQQNKRLLFAKCSSLTGCQNSYSDDAYKTTSPAPVLAALKATVNTPATWTVLQLQGTSTATEWGLMQVVTKSDASSPLLGTKAKFDNVTYKWLANPATASALTNAGLTIALNDFVDNALASVCADLTSRR
ncbi:hypothetical protein As57867_022696, partial [Aphanomyces stellatus]